MADTPEVIYLIPDGDGYVWCEDPAPGVAMEEKDAVKYLSAKAFTEQACDAAKSMNEPEENPTSFDNGYEEGISEVKTVTEYNYLIIGGPLHGKPIALQHAVKTYCVPMKAAVDGQSDETSTVPMTDEFIYIAEMIDGHRILRPQKNGK